MTIDRSKLLDAAARVYGEFGFRGATTRRIADEAGVNEITIFRQFGSKETLINEAIRTHAIRPLLPDLPEVPSDPARELTAWCSAVLSYLNHARSLIRRMMSEMDERPAVAPCVGDGPTYATLRLRAYVGRLGQHGLLAPPPVDVAAAISMLMSALFADAMGREMMPAMYPQPADRAATAYVALFLRALGVRPSPARDTEPVSARSA